MLSIFRAIALAALILTSSCHPPAIGAERARDYFAAHRTELDVIVEQVQLCQAGGRIDAHDDLQCPSSAGTPADVVSAITAADAQWIRVNYNERQGEPRVLSSILIAMPSSFGTSYAGVTEAFVYENEPEAEAAYERTDYPDGAYIERLPVTDAPHHWYWQMIHR